MSKKALFITIHSWDSVFKTGSYHIASNLIKTGYEIAYISAPLSPLHSILPTNELNKRWSNNRNRGKYFSEGKLWDFSPFSLVCPANKPLIRCNNIIRYWHLFSLPNMIRQVRKKGFGEVDLIYIDTIYQPFWLDYIPHKYSVFRVSDNYTGFPGFREHMLKTIKTIAGKCDLTIYPSVVLEDFVKQLKPKRYTLISNGYDSSLFNAEEPLINPYKDISRPVVLYIGALDKWFDYELLIEVSHRLTDIAFVLIGNNSKKDKLFRNHDNIYSFGPVDHYLLPDYIRNADVGIIPFNAVKYPDLIHPLRPLKLFEYLGCGLPVVTTDWNELHNFKPPVAIAKDVDGFCDSIINHIRNKPGVNILTDFTKPFDWESLTHQLLKMIP